MSLDSVCSFPKAKRFPTFQPVFSFPKITKIPMFLYLVFSFPKITKIPMFLYLVFSFPKAKRIPTFQPVVFSFPKIQLTHTEPSLCRIIEGKGEELGRTCTFSEKTSEKQLFGIIVQNGNLKQQNSACGYFPTIEFLLSNNPILVFKMSNNGQSRIVAT